MSSNTLVEADIWTVAQTDHGHVVFVRPKKSDVVVPIFIGQMEAQSILIGLGQLVMPRPITHDLMLSLIAGFGSKVLRVEIHDLVEGTFYAKLALESETGEKIVDCRPSDGIALAVRCSCDVFISESIVEDIAISVDVIKEPSKTNDDLSVIDDAPKYNADKKQHDAKSKISERKRLENDLARAIADENYELAALIRDRLELL